MPPSSLIPLKSIDTQLSTKCGNLLLPCRYFESVVITFLRCIILRSHRCKSRPMDDKFQILRCSGSKMRRLKWQFWQICFTGRRAAFIHRQPARAPVAEEGEVARMWRLQEPISSPLLATGGGPPRWRENYGRRHVTWPVKLPPLVANGAKSEWLFYGCVVT